MDPDVLHEIDARGTRRTEPRRSRRWQLTALVRSAAVEPGPSGVRVNAVAPGVVRTPRVAALPGTEGRRLTAENAPPGRAAATADIAADLYFLASPLSPYVTGQTLVVDGGVGVKFPTG
ncbi:SDR family oxidoreductase [Streptomyces virginiae]|uniref:SDR family oxidoreductase n=1 Tax=Streptomyces virginiae TaxID=1961 RepID=UPI00324D669E